MAEPGAGVAPAMAARIWTAVIAILLAAFSIYAAYFGVFPDMIQRPAHLGLVLALVFGSTVFAGPARAGWRRAVASALLVAAVVTMGYHVIFHDVIAAR